MQARYLRLMKYSRMYGMSRHIKPDNTVMVHIRRLREKLEAGHHDTPLIKTVWGVGYKVETDR